MDKFQSERLNGVLPKAIEVCSDVPQGSHCGLLLFILFVNGGERVIKYSKCIQFYKWIWLLQKAYNQIYYTMQFQNF